MGVQHRQELDVTVAGLCERDGQILVVREHASGKVVLNLPGGHIEAGETPEQAVIREVREETGLVFKPRHLLGCYIWERPRDGKRYLRIVYNGATADGPTGSLEPVVDPNIVAAEWLTVDAIAAAATDHRYPIVQRSVDDFLAGVRSPRRLVPPGVPLARSLDAVTAQALVIN